MTLTRRDLFAGGAGHAIFGDRPEETCAIVVAWLTRNG
jgi:hypothetical protein